ncbi:MAG: glycosyltransferase family 4 protein [Paracoccaceae bacterium]
MRILQIGHNYHVSGGSDAVMFATSDLLTKAGHEVIPFCMDHPNNQPTRWSSYFPRSADTRAMPIRDGLRYFYNIDARVQLQKLLEDVGTIDVAHLHIYHGKQTAAILPILRKHGIPIIQTLHEYKLACPVYTMQRNGRPCELCLTGSDFNCIWHRCKNGSTFQSTVMAAEKLFSRIAGDVSRIDRFICVSEFQRQIMGRTHIPVEKLHTLHNFVRCQPNVAPGHDGYFLFFGRLEKLKGMQTLINAFKKCGQRLIIAGDGDWRGALENQISRIDTIEYVGFQTGSDLTKLISRARAVVVPSEWNENCPMSVLEAKALGRPVIGARIGGIPELIQPGIDGALFDAGDQDSLAAAVSEICMADHDRLSSNALKDALKRFSETAHLDQLFSHYEYVISKASIAAPILA